MYLAELCTSLLSQMASLAIISPKNYLFWCTPKNVCCVTSISYLSTEVRSRRLLNVCVEFFLKANVVLTLIRLVSVCFDVAIQCSIGEL